MSDSSPLIYLDNHATTRVDPRVVEAMLPFFSENYGNAGSRGYALGEQARMAVESARTSMARDLGTEPESILFTSGATESNNLAIQGVAQWGRRRGDHWISARTEHPSVLAPLKRLASGGHRVTLLDVEQHPSARAGWLDPQCVADAILPDTCLVSVMLANNEIGVIQPLEAIAEICHERGVVLHCDATQGVGKIPLDLHSLKADLVSFSAHKFYGPKGVGGLVVRRSRPALRLVPQLLGGGQQAGLRSGTLNVPGIVGMAKALELCVQELPQETTRLTKLRNQLESGLKGVVEEIELCGPHLTASDASGGALRLPGNLNVAVPNRDGEALQMTMPQLAVSSGAACASARTEPSSVLLALGLTPDMARSSLRFGLGRFNSEQDILLTIEMFASAVAQLGKLMH